MRFCEILARQRIYFLRLAYLTDIFSRLNELILLTRIKRYQYTVFEVRDKIRSFMKTLVL